MAEPESSAVFYLIGSLGSGSHFELAADRDDADRIFDNRAARERRVIMYECHATEVRRQDL